LSDRFGRRPPILIGLFVYVLCALASPAASGFGELLSLRFAQGMAAAAIRVGILAAVRDSYKGAGMAEIMSIAMSVFLLVPILIPSVGQLILLAGPWQLVFLVVAGLAAVIGAWTFLRLPETLPRESRRLLDFASVTGAFAIVVRNRAAAAYGISSTFLLGIVVALINTSQQVYVDIYGIGPYFPLAFAVMGGTASIGFMLNARLVAVFGMRRLTHGTMLLFVAGSAVWFGMAALDELPLWLFLTMVALVTPLITFGFANAGALAMEPLGAVAGTASALFGAIQTVGGAILGWAVAQSFDGTVRPVLASLCIFGTCTLACYLIAEKGRLLGNGSSASVANAVAAAA
jgi:DHA1 family bicyclomycin/chloramphenicol resistance-like MFS transporter